MIKRVIVGCGDVGRRLASLLLQEADQPSQLCVTVRSQKSRDLVEELGLQPHVLDLDDAFSAPDYCAGAELYYLVPPQKKGDGDQRSRRLIKSLSESAISPEKLVLISTTGVYGDAAGEWVTETTPVNPTTERARRRQDAEHQWLKWGALQNAPVVILRVPGIYAFSRISRDRIARRTAVVRASECGFTNRIHADDLSTAMLAAMRYGQAGEIYNVSDGTPGKISDFLQAATSVLGLPALPEISRAQAENELSMAMLSYLSESRKISNQKMLDQLKVTLRYPDFKEGLKYG